MIDLTQTLYNEAKTMISSWKANGIYAFSFFVYSNEAYAYRGFSNVPEFSVGYNTESDCPGAGPYDEERWNFAFWRQNNVPIIDPNNGNATTDLLFDWYEENGIRNIGKEDFENSYDENGYYIGKGPIGHYELLTLVSEVAKRLQEEDFIKNHFGKAIPIIVHGLEYAWFDVEATKNANPYGEADVFLEYMERMENFSPEVNFPVDFDVPFAASGSSGDTAFLDLLKNISVDDILSFAGGTAEELASVDRSLLEESLEQIRNMSLDSLKDLPDIHE